MFETHLQGKIDILQEHNLETISSQEILGYTTVHCCNNSCNSGYQLFVQAI